jgi:hypothetical protein
MSTISASLKSMLMRASAEGVDVARATGASAETAGTARTAERRAEERRPIPRS